MRAMVLTFAFCLLPLAFAAAQSGRQPGQSKPSPPPAQETRPRRVDDDQDEIKLSANLITAITSVTDPAGNQVNDLTQQDFVVYEDNVAQEIAGFYREGQLPLRLIFLFDASTSILHRFDV